MYTYVILGGMDPVTRAVIVYAHEGIVLKDVELYCLPCGRVVGDAGMVGLHIRQTDHVAVKVLWEKEQWVEVRQTSHSSITQTYDVLQHCFSFLPMDNVWLGPRSVCRDWKLCCDALSNIEGFLRHRHLIMEARYVPAQEHAKHFAQSALSVAVGGATGAAGVGLVVTSATCVAVMFVARSCYKGCVRLCGLEGTKADDSVDNVLDACLIPAYVGGLVGSIATACGTAGVIHGANGLRNGVPPDPDVPSVPTIDSYQNGMDAPTESWDVASLSDD